MTGLVRVMENLESRAVCVWVMESKIRVTNDRFHIILKTTSQFKVMETSKKVLEKERG